MLTRVKYPTLASICLTESHTALRINKIILITFDKRANELWRNQLSFMSKIQRYGEPKSVHPHRLPLQQLRADMLPETASV
ncbi:hypothetical protein BFF47_24430 [Shigella sp. FC1764]|uniref:Uncharacterized protein n=1 Tax=Shigella boydii serotype 4 (strain Sb227) TaxID=300268 RepID=Q31SI9_SHIBS|nr:hypothetical protein SBO_P097 [Shigella boydii Sb227]ODG83167.1 hypothetical protein BFF48_23635 [Shigella sp. FC1882]ODG83688.1 hypothetical protein BFF47_24430 [Shigella sp. FC1764]ODJ30431.1 hypothetical protein BFR12_24015 [Shigella sp. FC2833]OEG28937.1 hypothetical protein BHQ32_23940 [Shigella sp. FC2117]OEG29197.1 hypothetical protein BHQ35_23920 [Shigella sp. FC2175]OEG29481.1 hypothetical protein BHQ33_23700 [Shigella sp. FC2125]OEG41305.1 hypothetical protein BHQ38_24185 [Shige